MWSLEELFSFFTPMNIKEAYASSELTIRINRNLPPSARNVEFIKEHWVRFCDVLSHFKELRKLKIQLDNSLLPDCLPKFLEILPVLFLSGLIELEYASSSNVNSQSPDFIRHIDQLKQLLPHYPAVALNLSWSISFRDNDLSLKNLVETIKRVDSCLTGFSFTCHDKNLSLQLLESNYWLMLGTALADCSRLTSLAWKGLVFEKQIQALALSFGDDTKETFLEELYIGACHKNAFDLMTSRAVRLGGLKKLHLDVALSPFFSQDDSEVVENLSVFSKLVNFLSNIPFPEKLNLLVLDVMELWASDEMQEHIPFIESINFIEFINKCINLISFTFHGNYVASCIQNRLALWVSEHPLLKNVDFKLAATGADLQMINNTLSNHQIANAIFDIHVYEERVYNEERDTFDYSLPQPIEEQFQLLQHHLQYSMIRDLTLKILIEWISIEWASLIFVAISKNTFITNLTLDVQEGYNGSRSYKYARQGNKTLELYCNGTNVDIFTNLLPNIPFPEKLNHLVLNITAILADEENITEKGHIDLIKFINKCVNLISFTFRGYLFTTHIKNVFARWISEHRHLEKVNINLYNSPASPTLRAINEIFSSHGIVHAVFNYDPRILPNEDMLFTSPAGGILRIINEILSNHRLANVIFNLDSPILRNEDMLYDEEQGVFFYIPLPELMQQFKLFQHCLQHSTVSNLNVQIRVDKITPEWVWLIFMAISRNIFITKLDLRIHENDRVFRYIIQDDQALRLSLSDRHGAQTLGNFLARQLLLELPYNGYALSNTTLSVNFYSRQRSEFRMFRQGFRCLQNNYFAYNRIIFQKLFNNITDTLAPLKEDFPQNVQAHIASYLSYNSLFHIRCLKRKSKSSSGKEEPPEKRQRVEAIAAHDDEEEHDHGSCAANAT